VISTGCADEYSTLFAADRLPWYRGEIFQLRLGSYEISDNELSML